jgi:ribonuclease-3
MSEDIILSSEVEVSLGYQFKNPALYLQARTHPSWTNENPTDPIPNYQRLEFLGDSVLKLLQATSLFNIQSDWKEGQLSEARSKLENNYNLSQWSRQLGLHKVIRHGKCIVPSEANPDSLVAKEDSLVAKEDSPQTKAWNLICAQVFEAMLGAIWEDCHYNFQVVEQLYEGWKLTDHSSRQINYKKEVQEFVQKRKWKLPKYTTQKVKGKDHQKEFLVTCEIVEIGQVATGTGSSTKIAEVKSAQQMYEYLCKTYLS